MTISAAGQDAGNVTLNLSTVSPEHELFQFPPYMVVILSVLYGIISAVAISGNSFVIYVIIRDQRMRSVTNFFIGNLSLADVLIGIFSIPFQFQAALLQTWNMPHFLCPVAPFVKELTVNVSILTLAVIAVDRYKAVLDPFRVKGSHVHTAVLKMSVVWLVSTLLAIPSAIVFRVNTDLPDKPQCLPVFRHTAVRQAYQLSLILTQYFLPLIIISVAYFRIACYLWTAQTPGVGEERRDQKVHKSKVKVRIAKYISSTQPDYILYENDHKVIF